MSVEWIRGRSIQQTFNLASSNIIHKGDILMMNSAGKVGRASSSMGLIDQAFAGIYEGPELSTSTRGTTDTIQLRVPIGPAVIMADTSGSLTTASFGIQYGIATSEISSGTSAMVGVANVDYGNFIHMGLTNSSGKNLFMLIPATIATST